MAVGRVGEENHMKRILITGAGPRSFVGRNLKEALASRYEVFTPPHSELELLDYDALEHYIKENRIDAIIHAAVHVPMFNGAEKEFYNDMQMFLNIEKVSRYVEKVLYFGSGAEFDKRYDITMVREEDFGRTIPVSEYGMAKYTMNLLARRSENIYNLRLFGIFGKYELWDIKFLSNLCCKAVFDLPLIIRRECSFDFLYIEDLPPMIEWFLEHTPRYHDYNICHGRPYRLTELADMVCAVSGKALPVTVLAPECNLDYTANNERLLAELPNIIITPMQTAIRKLYAYYEANRGLIDRTVLESSR